VVRGATFSCCSARSACALSAPRSPAESQVRARATLSAAGTPPAGWARQSARAFHKSMVTAQACTMHARALW